MPGGDPFLSRAYQPMLIGADSGPFDDPQYTYELKLDGERCLAYLDPGVGTALINKRSLSLLDRFPELASLHRQVDKRCVLDGELIVPAADGSPDFAQVQRRSLLSNRFKIELAAQRQPASLVAFDLLWLDGREFTAKPLEERCDTLAQTVYESQRLALSRRFSQGGRSLFALACERGLEGIVAKRRGSLYTPGKRTRDWVKIKNLQDDDFVVCGFIRKEQNVTSLVLGQYDNGGTLRYRGHVTLGVSGPDFRRIESAPRTDKAPCVPVPRGSGNERAIWLEPTLVCKVRYLHETGSGGLRHPNFAGLRDDKAPHDCLVPEKVE